jgi:hypothetical protein
MNETLPVILRDLVRSHGYFRTGLVLLVLVVYYVTASAADKLDKLGTRLCR